VTPSRRKRHLRASPSLACRQALGFRLHPTPSPKPKEPPEHRHGAKERRHNADRIARQPQSHQREGKPQTWARNPGHAPRQGGPTSDGRYTQGTTASGRPEPGTTAGAVPGQTTTKHPTSGGGTATKQLTPARPPEEGSSKQQRRATPQREGRLGATVTPPAAMRTAATTARAAATATRSLQAPKGRGSRDPMHDRDDAYDTMQLP
jgi:hypothetical protein